MDVVVKAGGPSPMEEVPVLLLPPRSCHITAPVPEPSAGQPGQGNQMKIPRHQWICGMQGFPCWRRNSP